MTVYHGSPNQDIIPTFGFPEEENGYLSNWYLSDFVMGEIHFSSVEQYMMYQKAITFDGSKKISFNAIKLETKTFH